MDDTFKTDDTENTTGTEPSALQNTSEGQTSAREERHPEQINVEDQGIINGIIRLDKEYFRQFIEHSQNQKAAELKLGRIALDLNEIRAKRTHASIQSEQLDQNTLKKKAELSDVKHEMDYNRDKLAGQEEIIAQRKKRKAALVFAYGWVPALLLVLAGCAFTTADVFITYDIVSYGLNMGGVDGWVFAIALAMIAVMLKPAYDRITEKPYQRGEKRRLNHGFLLAVGSLAIVSLMILGVFRSDADKIKGETRRYKLEIKELQREASSADDIEKQRINAEITRKQTLMDELDKGLSDNPWRLMAFIFSSVLFALSGTICFSIGFPAVESLIASSWLHRKIRKGEMKADPIRIELKKLGSAAEILTNEIDDLSAQKDKLPDIKSLDEKEAALLLLIEETTEYIHDQAKLKMIALYGNAYERGQNVNMDGLMHVAADDIQKMLDIPTPRPTFRATNGGFRKSGGNGVSRKATYSNERRRPFVMIRKIIAEDYANAKTGSDNDFEITPE